MWVSKGLLLQKVRLHLTLREFVQARCVSRCWRVTVDRLTQIECDAFLPEAFYSMDSQTSSLHLLRVLHCAHARVRLAAHDYRFADACVCASSQPSDTASGYITLCAFTFGVMRIDITCMEKFEVVVRILTGDCPMSFLNSSAAMLSDETLIVFGGELPLVPRSANCNVFTLDVSGSQAPERPVWKGPLRCSELHSASRPEPRNHSAIGVADDRVFIFGGVNLDFHPDQPKMYDDLWTLDLHADAVVWRRVEFEPGSRPCGRLRAAISACSIQDGRGRRAYRIFLHGGQGLCGDVLSDFWMFELEAIDVLPVAAPSFPAALRVARAVEIHQDLRMPRIGHALYLFGRLALIVGGADVDGFENDDVDNNSVNLLTCIMEPSYDVQASRWHVADIDGLPADNHFSVAFNGGRNLVVGGACCRTNHDRIQCGHLYEITLLNGAPGLR
eukprot:TRINITY_DN10763_c0_g2_i1.p1 TRINITY_DN10763_c0_g2~~TRINITY_DN10763_c0_g2_i1.p1  ORF type:complete len:468 (+),score=40.71 TRINITY_DN10763_c0_g2_i1:73-1404(+)